MQFWDPKPNRIISIGMFPAVRIFVLWACWKTCQRKKQDWKFNVWPRWPYFRILSLVSDKTALGRWKDSVSVWKREKLRKAILGIWPSFWYSGSVGTWWERWSLHRGSSGSSIWNHFGKHSFSGFLGPKLGKKGRVCLCICRVGPTWPFPNSKGNRSYSWKSLKCRNKHNKTKVIHVPKRQRKFGEFLSGLFPFSIHCVYVIFFSRVSLGRVYILHCLFTFFLDDFLKAFSCVKMYHGLFNFIYIINKTTAKLFARETLLHLW